jgi:hypothetical protein
MQRTCLKRYGFNSVHSLVNERLRSDTVETVDLGPSGSDDFFQVKARYGFASVEDCRRLQNT